MLPQPIPHTLNYAWNVIVPGTEAPENSLFIFPLLPLALFSTLYTALPSFYLVNAHSSINPTPPPPFSYHQSLHPKAVLLSIDSIQHHFHHPCHYTVYTRYHLCSRYPHLYSRYPHLTTLPPACRTSSCHALMTIDDFHTPL